MKGYSVFFALLAGFAFLADEPASKLNVAFRQVKNKYGAMNERMENA